LDFYRFLQVSVLCLMTYVGLQQLVVHWYLQDGRKRLFFAFSTLAIALYTLLTLIGSYRNDAAAWHFIILAQWFVVWILFANLVPFVELLFGNRLTWRSRVSFGVAVLQCALLVFLPGGGYLRALPEVVSATFPWGETVYTPNVEGILTWWHFGAEAYLICLSAILLTVVFKKKNGLDFLAQYYSMLLPLVLVLFCMVLNTMVDLQVLSIPLPFCSNDVGVIVGAFGLGILWVGEVGRDVTLQKRLAESEGRLRLLTQNIPCMLYHLRVSADGALEVLSLSGNVEGLLGLGTTVQNVYERFFSGLDAEDQARLQEKTKLGARDPRPFEFESRFHCLHCSEVRWYRCLSIPSEEKNYFHFSGLLLDETTQWQGNAERERLHAELEAKTEEQEHILYATSHDLRAPLLNISGFVNEMNEEMRSIFDKMESTPEVSEYKDPLESVQHSLHFVESSAERMAHLLDGLLAVIRLGRLPVSLQEVDTKRVIRSVLDAFEYRIRIENLSIEVEELSSCVGDPELLAEIFSNLVDNAIKYRCPERPLQLRFEGSIQGDEVLYHVRDNGIGFAQKHAKNVFRLFHRLQPRSGTEGHGVGLTIAKRLAQRMQGSIEVQSEEDVGSVFTIRMPRIL